MINFKDLLSTIDINNLDTPITAKRLITFLGGRINIYPVLCVTITCAGQRLVQHDVRDTGMVTIAYDWIGDTIDAQILTRIYIGHVYGGPMLCCVSGDGQWQWQNLYSHGNYGKNSACGGTFSAQSGIGYSTASAAINNRDYKVGKIKLKNAYTESRLMLDDVITFCKKHQM